MSQTRLSSLETQLIEYLEEREDELLRLSMDLISIPTPNPPGDNYKALCDLISEWLDDASLNVRVERPPEETLPHLLRPEARGQRYAILGELSGSGKGLSLCLQGHYDTVPPSDGWEIDPYRPELGHGKLYGLGATDMKGGLASMMMAAKALAKSEARLRGDLLFLATPDEEFFSGAGLAYFLQKGIVQPDFAIVGEPSGAQNVHIGMKGGIWGDIIVHGKAVHGSRPFEGINAFEKMVGVVDAMRSKLYPLLAGRVSEYDFHPSGGNCPTLALGGLVSGTNASRATVPDRFAVSFDRRLIPEENLDEVELELASFLEGLQLEDRELSLEMKVSSKAPPMVVPTDAELCQVLSDVVGELSGHPPTHTVSCGGFETALFVDRGVQALTYGPGEDAFAHAAGEHTLVSELAFAAKVYALTASRLLA
jgi:succinyl-diaminopimelate desuccinylase